MLSTGSLADKVRRKLDELIEILMLHPGTARVVSPLVVFRLLVLGVASSFLIVLPLLERFPDPFFWTMLSLALTVLAVSLLLRWARRLRSPGLLKAAIVGAFCSDLIVEIVGLMASGLSHSTIVVLPLLSLATAAVFVGVRESVFCALFFALCYPLGAYAVSSGAVTLHSSLQWTGLGQQVPTAQVVSFALAQELFFGLVLIPFWVLVRKLRFLYHNFSTRLEQAIARAETEVHARARERRELEQRLQQAQKLESLGLLAGGVAHDFNNIMVGIMGHAELMAIKVGGDSEHHRPLSRIIAATRRAAGLCKQMLTYSGQGVVHLEPVDLNALIQEVPHLLGAAMPQGAALELELAPSLPPIDADAGQLSQVTMNLIINAGEALGQTGGKVEVHTGVYDPADSLELPAGWHQLSWQAEQRSGPHAFLQVRDDGCGMDEEIVDKIFDPFFSTKFAGRGLGLSAVMGIVHSHRGVIAIASRPGEGTLVRVGFPLSQRRHTRRRSTPRVQPGWRGSGRVLVVDDDPDVIQVVSDMLTILGFEAVAAKDGQQALALLREQAQQLRFVICDVAMPGMDGAAVREAARAISPEMPFVLASGFSEADMRRRFPDQPVEFFLQKPFSYAQLQQMAQQLLDLSTAEGAAGPE